MFSSSVDVHISPIPVCVAKEALCLNLGVGPVPGWVTSLAGVGAMLRTGMVMNQPKHP